MKKIIGYVVSTIIYIILMLTFTDKLLRIMFVLAWVITLNLITKIGSSF